MLVGHKCEENDKAEPRMKTLIRLLLKRTK